MLLDAAGRATAPAASVAVLGFAISRGAARRTGRLRAVVGDVGGKRYALVIAAWWSADASAVGEWWLCVVAAIVFGIAGYADLRF